MSSILEQNPEATVTEALGLIPEELISKRERLRMRALIGGVPVNLLANSDASSLAAVLTSDPIAGLPDRTVIFGFTMPISPKRVLVVAELFLECLHDGVPVIEDPTPASESTPPAASMPEPKGKPARQRPLSHGLEVTLIELRSEVPQPRSTRGSGAFKGKPKPGPRGRPVTPSAEATRMRRGVDPQE